MNPETQIKMWLKDLRGAPALLKRSQLVNLLANTYISAVNTGKKGVAKYWLKHVNKYIDSELENEEIDRQWKKLLLQLIAVQDGEEALERFEKHFLSQSETINWRNYQEVKSLANASSHAIVQLVLQNYHKLMQVPGQRGFAMAFQMEAYYRRGIGMEEFTISKTNEALDILAAASKSSEPMTPETFATCCFAMQLACVMEDRDRTAQVVDSLLSSKEPARVMLGVYYKLIKTIRVEKEEIQIVSRDDFALQNLLDFTAFHVLKEFENILPGQEEVAKAYLSLAKLWSYAYVPEVKPGELTRLPFKNKFSDKEFWGYYAPLEGGRFAFIGVYADKSSLPGGLSYGTAASLQEIKWNGDIANIIEHLAYQDYRNEGLDFARDVQRPAQTLRLAYSVLSILVTATVFPTAVEFYNKALDAWIGGGIIYLYDSGSFLRTGIFLLPALMLLVGGALGLLTHWLALQSAPRMVLGYRLFLKGKGALGFWLLPFTNWTIQIVFLSVLGLAAMFGLIFSSGPFNNYIALQDNILIVREEGGVDKDERIPLSEIKEVVLTVGNDFKLSRDRYDIRYTLLIDRASKRDVYLLEGLATRFPDFAEISPVLLGLREKGVSMQIANRSPQELEVIDAEELRRFIAAVKAEE